MPAASTDASFTRIGLLSDVQWSPHAEMGTSFHGTPRFYRDALLKAKRAVESFKSQDCDLVIHLGDIVDYHAGLHERTEEAFERILDETLHTLDVPGTFRLDRLKPGARNLSLLLLLLLSFLLSRDVRPYDSASLYWQSLVCIGCHMSDMMYSIALTHSLAVGYPCLASTTLNGRS
jgi:hypothetical protein